MASCFVFALPLQDQNFYFEFLCTETYMFLSLSPIFLCLIVVLHHFSAFLSASYFLLSVIFSCRAVPVMLFAVLLSVQSVCGLCYCMHMQFHYGCSPQTASSALYGRLLLSNIPGDIVLCDVCGAECLNVCVFVRQSTSFSVPHRLHVLSRLAFGCAYLCFCRYIV